MASMSTPIQQLQNAAPPPTAEVPQDPEVLNVLSEMEQEVAAASRSHATPQAPPPPVATMQHPQAPPPMRPVPVMPTQVSGKSQKGIKGWYNPELLQKAAILTLIVLVLFYPATMQFVYAKVPQYEAMLQSYDIVIRSIVFGVLVYVLLLKFNV